MLDVAIVGAGPSGTAAATILAEKGFKVAVFEKEKLPRHKDCGGGVAIRCLDALKKLDVKVEEVSLQEYKGFILSYKDLMARCDLGMIIGWGVYREDFDYLITKRAIESGATVFEKRRVVGAKEKGGTVRVITKSGVKNAKLLFGADGINSIVRRSLDVVYKKEKLGLCLLSEVKTSREKINEYDDMINLDFSYLREGFTWAFPKKRGKTINVGVGGYLQTIQKSNLSMRELLVRFVRERGIADNVKNIHGALIPFGGTVDCFGKGNIILLGDAAGLVSPMSGEGIPYALDSGIIAADCATKFFEQQIPLEESYTQDIAHLTREINDYALTLQKRIYGTDTHRRLVVQMCVDHDKLFNTIGKIFLHTIPYEEGMKRLSLIRLLPLLISTWYRRSIWSPVSITPPKPMVEWVRM